ncbi:MAG: S-layer homology domain-containing protein [Veillonella sp.]|uniref:S-layer homology domain-containing protein n=1 Tax=Veillonella sp. TaxID=1926307 RepID=UPI002580D6C8|nr:S-layer homology domain-containing protein [Veillonella sp.]MBS7012074.1 S-layer homology domain-containing protein [Veillonella sp.]
MRENKHSKKLAFAVLAATAAVGVSAVAPVSAAPINTADGLIVTSDTPVSSNVAVPTTVVTGSGNIAVGQQNEVRSTSGSTSAFGNQNYVNGQDANAFGDGNAAFGHYAQVFGDTNEANGNQTVAYGYNNIVGEFQAASSPTDSHRVDPTTAANRSAAVGVQNKIAGGAENATAFGVGNTVSIADHSFRDRTSDNEPDSATRQAGSYGANSVAVGNSNTVSGDAAIAIGSKSQATLSNATAIGNTATANRVGTIAIGTRAQAGDFVANPNVVTDAQLAGKLSARQDGADRAVAVGYESRAVGYKSNAIGSGAWALDNHSTAIGSSAQATANHAQAFGAGAQATGVRSNVFGSDAIASERNTLALGDSARATHENSVAIGAGSVTSAAQGFGSYRLPSNSAQVVTFAGANPTGSVSVGAAGQERQIHNVAAGRLSATSTDAVNGSQLYSVANELQRQIDNTVPGQINNNITNLTNRVGDVEQRVNKVGAGSAALAALHPLDFNPDDKWTVAAGYGHYHNANSAALGAFYRPNEDTMFSIGSTVGNGNPQLNAGVSIRLGKRAPESRSRVAMGREIAELNARLQDIENKYNNLLQVLNPHAIDPSKTAEFPDVPRNHWAYQYISQLAGNGILVGYPDGTFKGDATMTRYEFATMLYRALQNGAPIDDNMRRAMDEFQPELQNIRLNHYRVDRISGGDNDRHKTERVRVNNEPKNQRDVYGSRISQ